MARIALAAILFLVLFATLSAKPSRDKNRKSWRLVCYLGSWAKYRHGDGNFEIEDIDPYLCTHLVYAFTKLENDRMTVYDPYLDLIENWGKGAYERFNNLREKNSQLTTLIAIGGWNEGSRKYSDMAREPARRRVFVNSVMEFLQKYDFDGLDFDWEYPSNREGSRPEDKDNFVQLLKELKDAFAPHGYLLTAAVSAGKSTMDGAYDIPKVAKYLDFINLMAYDYHGGWANIAGHNAPLFSRPGESVDHQLLNANYSVNYWLSHGTPAHKLVLGMPLYGRCLYLSNPSNRGFGAPVTGPGLPGPFTNEPGMIGYNELCVMLKNQAGQWQISWEDNHKVPFASKGNQWCGYDDERSLTAKVDYLKSMGLGGAMVWSLETDDFRAKCTGRPYPLLTTIHHGLAGGHPVTFPTIPTETATSVVLDHGKCKAEGSFSEHGACQSYYQCILQSGVLHLVERNCPSGTSFDNSKKQCVHSALVPGCEPVTNIHTTSQFSVPTTQTQISTSEPPVPTFHTRPPVVTTSIKTSTTQPIVSTTERLISTTPRIEPTTPRIEPTTQRSVPTTTRLTTTHINELPTTEEHSSEDRLVCTAAGTFAHPTDCSKFYKCQKLRTGFKISVINCPPNLVFNRKSLNCDFPRNVVECQVQPRIATANEDNTDPCESDGFRSFPEDCTKFVYCTKLRNAPRNYVVLHCPKGLYYHHRSHKCEWEKPDNC